MTFFTSAYRLFSVFVAGLVFMTLPVMAVAQQIPSVADPGIIARTLEQDGPGRGAMSDVSIVLPTMDDPVISGSTEKIFVLNDIILDENTVYDPKDLQSITDEFKGEEVSFADLNRIAANLTRKYRNDGYIFSRVVLPPQKIKDGIVHMRAIEGRVENVNITGDYKDRLHLIRAMANKIHSTGPTNTRDIERYLLLIDDLPGITARSFVTPSETQGAGDLTIVVEQKAFEGSLSVDNRGSRFVGPWRGEAVAALNSVFGMHDRTTLRTIIAAEPRELRYGEIMHEQQIMDEGLRLKGRYALTATKPGGSLRPLGIDGDNELFDLEALFPAIRSRDLNLNLIGGFMANNTKTTLSDIEIGKDRIRSMRMNARLDFMDSWLGINQFDLGATQGLRVFGATDDGIGRSRANGDHTFLRFNATATRVQDLGLPGVSAFISATAQQTSDPLLASEEFTVGGASFGRGYDSGEIAGDKGYAGLFELRYSDFVENHKVLESYQLYSYVDYGKVKNVAPIFGEQDSESITSIGAGIRFNLKQDFSGYFEVSQPLDKDVNAEEDKGTRVFVNLIKRF